MNEIYKIKFRGEVEESQIRDLLNVVSVSEESYNGWDNYETWVLSLHLEQTEYIKNIVLEIINEHSGIARQDALKSWVEGMFEEVLDGEAHDDFKLMYKDVGSLWRVNFKEIIKYWKD